MAREILELRKFVCPEFVFGAGARHMAGRCARNLGANRVLVVTDRGVVAAGWTDEVTGSLRASGPEFAVFADVTSNPRTGDVKAGAEVYAKERCNAIVAVGGGSPMDCAKGIGIVAAHGRPIEEFEGVDTVVSPPPPLICVPTTAGSAAEVSQFAIITDMERRLKFCVIGKALVPDISLVDPETLTTMSPALTACTGLDALCHAIEAFVSNAHSPITDLHALSAVRRIARDLEAAAAKPLDAALRRSTMLGSLDAGLAFSNASLGLTHAMAHSLGGLLDLPHGECNAMVLLHAIAFNFAAAPQRYERIAEAMGIDTRGLTGPRKAAALLAEVKRLCTALAIGHTLGQVGVRRADIPALAERALRDPCMVTNPRPATQREIEVVYEESL